MTGICGVVGPTEAKVTSAIDDIQKSMWRRGSRTKSVLTHSAGRWLGVGVCDLATGRSGGLRFPAELTVAVDGFFYGGNDPFDKAFRRDQLGSLASALGTPGAYSFIAALNDSLIAGRDSLGLKPLYHGARSGLEAFASLKAGLNAIGVEKPEPVPKGALVATSKETLRTVDATHCLGPGAERDVSLDDAVSGIQDLFMEAVSETVSKNPAIAFSGGLDSALVAAAASESGKDPELITVGLEGQTELDHAKKVSTDLGLPLTTHVITPTEIIDSLNEVVPIVETQDPVIVGVSIPFYFACRKAMQVKRETIVAGQMSDELFGGYARFEELVLEGKPDQARSKIWESVLAASTNDFEPGDKVASSFGLEMRCPFAHLPLVNFALQLPIPLKVRASGGGVVRKYVLRKLAEKMRLPEAVVNRPKKAVQYSTGVQKILAKEARAKNLDVGRYLASFMVRC